jgi:hypothetical protein
MYVCVQVRTYKRDLHAIKGIDYPSREAVSHGALQTTEVKQAFSTGIPHTIRGGGRGCNGREHGARTKKARDTQGQREDRLWLWLWRGPPTRTCGGGSGRHDLDAGHQELPERNTLEARL